MLGSCWDQCGISLESLRDLFGNILGFVFGRQRAKFGGPAKLVGLRASPPRSAKLGALDYR